MLKFLNILFVIKGVNFPHIAQIMKFLFKDFFRKRDQIRSFLRIWSHLLKKSLIENFIFYAVGYKLLTNQRSLEIINERENPLRKPQPFSNMEFSIYFLTFGINKSPRTVLISESTKQVKGRPYHFKFFIKAAFHKFHLVHP